MENEMKPTGFLSLPQELQCHILAFLPWRDILRLTSVCKTLHQTYMSSCELQYIVELGGQQLLPFPDTHLNSHIPISKRLQFLRDKAHAWLRFDIRTSQSIPIPQGYYNSTRIFNNGHLFVWGYSSRPKIFPILPEASRQTVERDWSPESLCSVPNATIMDLFLDLSQNMIAIAYVILDGILVAANQKAYIDLGAPDGDGIPPKAAGRTLFPSVLLPRHETRGFLPSRPYRIMGSGRHIALQHSLDLRTAIGNVWWLQIWDWQHSTTSNCILSDTTNIYCNPSFCLLGGDRLLTVSDKLKLYSIEDVSQAPQLLSCFLLPMPATSNMSMFVRPMHASPCPTMQARQAAWTTDPEERLLFLSMSRPDLCFIISTRIFFFKEVAAEIPWKYWGPLNTRAFQGFGSADVVGNRILQAFPIDPTRFTELRLRMMDFSPLAVRRGQELGQAVKEPSTITIAIGEKRELVLTTSLPYAEVVSDRKFRGGEIAELRFDHDRIYLSQNVNRDARRDRLQDQVEVIEI